ncbi:adenylyltransferase/cytidyltransferase family protein [Streptomyces sp. DSM 44917]|uniref:Adenylyltransferase/cytidyltransferase family protein n=1 Tax=Streptomyces boetiae TaxID=3075541 RepID=A0ABU2L3S3_9ACTN|nr:adenylyltransferase/cytidyltransferase family protein [Streptomyces sp. DSM 44917]MDT0306205.1 adenylyltransferase/cytidyltransferase family protein [Streptomyces sp. DSM 44917]
MAHIVGYAPGVYDLFHVGHLNILRHARSRCDYLVAGVVSDEMAELAKGRPPVIPLVERLEIVRSIRFVDAAFVETVPEKLETWKQVRFDVMFKGDDWRGTPKGDKLERDFGGIGVEIVYLPYTVHTSSTQLRGALDALSAPAGAASADSSRNHFAENAAQKST